MGRLYGSSVSVFMLRKPFLKGVMAFVKAKAVPPDNLGLGFLQLTPVIDENFE